MDNSAVFNKMFDKAIEAHPEGFIGFDRTKNVQDQLQEMVDVWALELLDKFYTFCMWDEQFEELRDKMNPTSMEQLWLA